MYKYLQRTFLNMSCIYINIQFLFRSQPKKKIKDKCVLFKFPPWNQKYPYSFLFLPTKNLLWIPKIACIRKEIKTSQFFMFYKNQTTKKKKILFKGHFKNTISINLFLKTSKWNTCSANIHYAKISHPILSSRYVLCCVHLLK